MSNFKDVSDSRNAFVKRWVRVVDDGCYISVTRCPYAGGFFGYETAIVFAPAYPHPPFEAMNQVLKMQGDHRDRLNELTTNEVLSYGLHHVERYGNF